MERVRFLLPRGPDVECLLNPEAIEMQRTSGIRPLPTIGAGLSRDDDPVQRTRGGTTRLGLKLLFDVSLSQPGGAVDDVRILTRPLWRLSLAAGLGSPASQRVHLIWGKQWDIPGDVEALSERLESFTVSGAPRRAWVSMSFITDSVPGHAGTAPGGGATAGGVLR